MDDMILDGLTARQRDCLRLVGLGLSSKEIAGELGIAPGTVDLHVKRAMRELGATTRGQAARMLRAVEQADAKPDIQLLDTQAAPLEPATDAVDQITPERSDTAPFRVPFLRQGRQYNDLSPVRRLVWIGALAAAMMLAAANFLNGLDALHRLNPG